MIMVESISVLHIRVVSVLRSHACGWAQVERKVMMEVLEPECMHAAGLIADLDGWRKKEIRYNTKALYTVNK